MAIPDQQTQEGQTFRLKLEGNLEPGVRISPQTLGIARFARLFDKFKKLIESSLEQSPDLSLDKINFRYEHGSAVLMSDIPQQAHTAIQAEVRMIEDGHPINVAASRIAAAIFDIKHEADTLGPATRISLGTEHETYIELTPETTFQQLREVIVDTELIVYGKLFAVGGKRPNVHLASETLGTLIVSVNEMEAKELAERLYEEVGMRITAKQNILTREVLGPVYKGTMPYSRVLNEEKFRADKELGTRVWAGVDAVAWVRELRDGKT